MINRTSPEQETRIALLEQSMSHLRDSLSQMDRKIDQRFDDIDNSLEKTATRLDKVTDLVWSNFFWLLGAILGISGAGIGILLKRFASLS